MADYSPQQTREAITRAFDTGELELFISDFFSDALKDIPANASLNEQAQKLVTHCQRRDRFDELIEKIRQERPNAFEPATPKKDTLPRRTQFFGRMKEIEQVMRALGPNDRSWGIVLDGIGGIGKTALAVECAYRSLEAGQFGAVVFVSAKTNKLISGEIKLLTPTALTIDEFLNETARALGREAIIKEAGDAKRRALLATLRGSRTLLLFDNLETLSKEDHEAMADWLRELPEGCKALLTSRRRGGNGAVWVRLNKLEDNAARQIVLAEMEKDEALAAKFNRVAPISWQTLIVEAGGSPLALTSVLGLLRKRSTLSVEGAIDLLRHKDADADLLRFVFQEARKDLIDNDVIALRTLSFFASSSSFEAWMEVAGLSRAALQNTIDRLTTLSLLNLSEVEERYALHPLTRGFAQSELLSDLTIRREMSLRFAHYWVDYTKRFGESAESYKDIPKLESEWDNLNSAAKLLWQMVNGVSPQSNFSIADRDAAQLLMSLVSALHEFLWFSGRWEEWLMLSILRYTAAIALEDWGNTGNSASDIAYIYLCRDENDHAETWIERAITAWRQTNNKNGLAIEERKLGAIALDRGDYPTAQQKFEVALTLFREIGHQSGEGTAFSDLGDLASRQKDYGAAEQYYRAALNLAEKVKHVDGQAFYRNRLGGNALNRMDYARARVWLEQALLLAQDLSRQDLIASIKLNLAKICEIEGKREEALKLALEASLIDEMLQHGMYSSAQMFLGELRSRNEMQ